MAEKSVKKLYFQFSCYDLVVIQRDNREIFWFVSLMCDFINSLRVYVLNVLFNIFKRFYLMILIWQDILLFSKCKAIYFVALKL